MGNARSAFSLVEILVAVSVAAVLTTLGLSSLRNIQKEILQTRALHQIRQLGQACSLYSAENGGRLPGSSHSGNSWVGGLLPYLGLTTSASADAMKKVYRSPGDSHKTRLYSYAINDFLLPYPAGAVQLNYSYLASVPAPSQTILFAETQPNQVGSDHFHFAYGYSNNAFKNAVAVERYPQGGLYLFADYHVETIKWTTVQTQLTASGSKFVHPAGNP